jgi:hypothetical protein
MHEHRAMKIRNNKINSQHVPNLHTTFHTTATLVHKKQRLVTIEREAEWVPEVVSHVVAGGGLPATDGNRAPTNQSVALLFSQQNQPYGHKAQ